MDTRRCLTSGLEQFVCGAAQYPFEVGFGKLGDVSDALAGLRVRAVFERRGNVAAPHEAARAVGIAQPRDETQEIGIGILGGIGGIGIEARYFDEHVGLRLNI